MDWITGMQNAIDYIEEHITEKVDYEEIARCSCLSSYNFQRVFGILCGYTLGEYIRNRRLSMAGQDLAQTGMKVIDVALKYGYESPDSFAKAFQKFHGVTPSAAREAGAVLRSFARLSVKISLEGGSVMNYRIEEKPEMILTGYKQRFQGVPYGEERASQEEKLFVTTRGKQWILRGASCDYETDYCIVANLNDEGYDFYIANQLDEWTRDVLYDHKITGVEFMETLELEHIIIPKQLYVVVETEKMKRPINEYIDLRRKLVSEWLPGSGYQIAEAPELAVLHWAGQKDRKYIEIWLPIENIRS